MRMTRMLAAGALVLLVACGSEATQSVSSGNSEDARAREKALRPAPAPVDPADLATRWRVVQTSTPLVPFPFQVGDVVEFRPGGALSAGAEELALAGSWTLKDGGNQVEISTEAGSAVSAVSMNGDLLRLTDPAGRSTTLRRYLGPPQGPLPGSVVLDEINFASLVRGDRVESATVTQSGSVVIVNGVYNGDRTAERYSVTLRDCHLIRSLEASFSRNGVLTDGLPASELQC